MILLLLLLLELSVEYGVVGLFVGVVASSVVILRGDEDIGGFEMREQKLLTPPLSAS